MSLERLAVVPSWAPPPSPRHAGPCTGSPGHAPLGDRLFDGQLLDREAAVTLSPITDADLRSGNAEVFDDLLAIDHGGEEADRDDRAPCLEPRASSGRQRFSDSHQLPETKRLGF